MASESWSGPRMRKTRFVCISDTHNQTPKLPQGDVLIHAGDLTNQGSLTELRKTTAWLERMDFEVKIVVAGNHDITLDKGFFHENGALWRFPQPQDPDECLRLLTDSPSITYLQHQPATIRLQSSTGPHTQFKVFGSPYSPVLFNWAFQYAESDATKHWDDIPLDTDIVITHTPPRNHCDATGRGHSRGCEALRQALWRVRPNLAVCGHIHEGRGAELVQWKLDGQEAYLEEGTELWQDPGAGNNMQSLVDLTAKAKSWKPPDIGAATTRQGIARPGSQTEGGGQPDGVRLTGLKGNNSSLDGLKGSEDIGYGERKETCVINAAFMAASWGGGPKRFNKPIVVDIDLPIWTDAAM